MIDRKCSFLVVSSGNPFCKVEAHLRAEPGQGAGAGAVLLLDTAVEDQLHQVEILAHAKTLTSPTRAVQVASIPSILASFRTRFEWAGRSSITYVNGMRYQRAELPLKLDGIEAAQDLLRRLPCRGRFAARKPVGRAS